MIPRPRPASDLAAAGSGQDGHERQVLGWLAGCGEAGTATIGALLWQARLVGRAEGTLTSGQLGTLLSALGDAVAYRRSGASDRTCLACEGLAAEHCADHAGNLERARAYSELALLLAAGV